ncbi:hypothetical protein EK904_007005 [Melospiza melodia maxima]|nr:hypothetical protein EK904_007005 [Melospiza melodia maxima]
MVARYQKNFKEIYPKNRRTAPFHAGHQMRWHQLGTKLAFVTWEGGKCTELSEARPQKRLLKYAVELAPNNSKGFLMVLLHPQGAAWKSGCLSDGQI